MVICFNCSAEAKSVLDQLVGTGQYRDYSEVISVALTNLAVLQGELTGSAGAIVIGPEDGTVKQASTATDAKEEALQTEAGPSGKEFARGDPGPDGFSNSGRLPELFLTTDIEEPRFPLATLPAEDWSDGQDVPPQRWLWGQYNKLLPAKASCRALAHLLEGSPAGVPLETAVSRISEQAAILGDLLAWHDEQNQLKRGEALSTAFPHTGADAGKGRLRYANQFVAGVTRQGRLSGLLADLKLIGFADEDNLLLLTRAGWHFATLRNPVLDDFQEDPVQKFAKEEKDLLLDHIAASVPVEDSAYRTILEAVGRGADTPDGLDSYLGEKFSTDVAGAGQSRSFMSTQRSGAISRMADLGLITRRRNGTRISYIVTDRGSQYVECSGSKKEE